MDAVKLYMPTSFSELTKKQLLYISQLFLSQYSQSEFLLKAFLFLTGLKLLNKPPAANGARWFKSKKRKPFLIDIDVLHTLTQNCTFLFSASEVQPVKWIKGSRALNFRLYNATLDQYLMAENYFFAFAETKDEQHLDNLISVLYRHPWQRWNANKIQKRAKKFKSVSPEVKNAVFIWYIGFRGFVPRRCPSLFTSKGSSGSPNVRRYINGIIHQLTGGDITRKKHLLQQTVWDALDELEQRAFQNLENERNLKNKK